MILHKVRIMCWWGRVEGVMILHKVRIMLMRGGGEGESSHDSSQSQKFCKVSDR